MRNLKRALSLALASVMLLGMMVVGSSAAFADADEIVNTEAVEITAGLGLFAGSDGKFNPKGNVTRAQMATVIVKMLYGSEINADQYKGINKFSDVAAFEGGWAEGYINLCASLEIVGGYGDGTFKPGQAVTTAEAVTMIINALDIDAGEGTWPMTVMAKAEEIELFEDMEGAKPGTNVAMVRDQLAVIVWNGLNYSAEGVKGYSVTGSNIVFDSWADAAAYADKAITDEEGNATWGTNDINPIKNDTLAKTVFELKPAFNGYVTANQATGEDFTMVGGVKLDLETGLDMLGHYVTVYYSEAYQNENKPGEAFCLIEAAEYVEVAELIDEDRKDYLAAFGSKVEADAIAIMSFDGAAEAPESVTYDEDEFIAQAGTYVIDKENGKIRAYIAPVSYAVDVVTRVTTTAGKEAIKIGINQPYDNTEDGDEIVEYDGIAEDDVVVVKNYNGLTYVFKADVISGKVTKANSKDGKDYTYIDGTAYENSRKDVSAADLTDPADIDVVDSAEITYDAYLYNGKLLGLVKTAGATTLNDTIYVVDVYDKTVEGAYKDTTNFYAQGIDAAGKEVSILIGVGAVIEENEIVGAEYGKHTLEEGFYTFKKATGTANKELSKRDIMLDTPAKVLYTEDDELKFNEKTDKFFAEEVTGTFNADELKKDDKFIYIGGDTKVDNRVYLTANTKFVVIDKATFGNKLDIVTYTGSIAKDITDDDLFVAVSLDANDNKQADVVIISAGTVSLKADDYIFVVDGAASGDVVGGVEYTVYFTATNEFKTIVSADEVESGFYGDYTIDEDGIYNLGESKDYADVKTTQTFDGIFGESAISSGNIDLYDAANAVVVDVRPEDVIEDSEVAEIASLKDIVSANKAKYKVVFSAIVDEEDEVVTHIFVTDIRLPVYNEETNEIDSWVSEQA